MTVYFLLCILVHAMLLCALHHQLQKSVFSWHLTVSTLTTCTRSNAVNLLTVILALRAQNTFGAFIKNNLVVLAHLKPRGPLDCFNIVV